jgi:Family of unknown function (DUF6312)
MESVDLGRVARRITIVPAKGTEASPVIIYERKKKKRKGSLLFRRMDKMVRKSMEAQRAYADDYLRRHAKSNAERKDGWVRDGMYNNMRAGKTAMKQLKKLLF